MTDFRPRRDHPGPEPDDVAQAMPNLRGILRIARAISEPLCQTALHLISRSTARPASERMSTASNPSRIGLPLKGQDRRGMRHAGWAMADTRPAEICMCGVDCQKVQRGRR